MKRIDEMKKDYEKVEMTAQQIETMKLRMTEAKMEKRRMEKNKTMRKMTAAAAAIAVFIALPNVSANAASVMSSIPVVGQLVKVVTFTNYQYADKQHNADVTIPELIVESPATDAETENAAKENLENTTTEINQEIQTITDQIVNEFKENIKNQDGYQDVLVQSEVLNTTNQYFTLKLICYQAAASGYEQDYYYTIDLKTGERMALKDFFKEGADYITPISENIKQQMQEQMDADEGLTYWLHDEIEDLNFKEIKEDASFYINENGNLVINFDEYEVAPGYMGTVSFVIPEEVIQNIRK